MKHPFTILWPHVMKNDYTEKQDNEADTERSRKSPVSHVSKERQIDREKT